MKEVLTHVLLIVAFLTACNNSAGHSGASNDIAESKKREVFIDEYIAVPNPYKINDTLQITVNEAWIERQWAYSQDTETTIITEGYQLCINSVESDLYGINSKWKIGVEANKYIRSSSKRSLIGNLNELPVEDTLVYPVQKGNKLSSGSIKEVIGYFVLVRKK